MSSSSNNNHHHGHYHHKGSESPACTACPACRYPFAPGAVTGGPAVHRPRRVLRRLLPRAISPLGALVLQAMALLLCTALLGHLAGVAQARGWFL